MPRPSPDSAGGRPCEPDATRRVACGCALQRVGAYHNPLAGVRENLSKAPGAWSGATGDADSLRNRVFRADRNSAQARGAPRQRMTKAIRGLRSDGCGRAVGACGPEPEMGEDLLDDFGLLGAGDDPDRLAALGVNRGVSLKDLVDAMDSPSMTGESCIMARSRPPASGVSSGWRGHPAVYREYPGKSQREADTRSRLEGAARGGGGHCSVRVPGDRTPNCAKHPLPHRQAIQDYQHILLGCNTFRFVTSTGSRAASPESLLR